MKLVWMFPGQGAQAVGMGRELAESLPQVMAVFDRANEALGWDLKKMVFEGPEEALKETQNTQPCLYATSLAILEAVRPFCPAPAFVAGHSLGEYSALAAAGAYTFEDGIKLVQARATAMSEAGKSANGGMAAVLGLDDAVVRELCEKATAGAGAEEAVEPANFNCAGQVVISGSKAALDKAMVLAKEAGAAKVIALAVSGPFHSRFMAPVGRVLQDRLQGMPRHEASIPLVANASAGAVVKAEDWSAGLVRQVSGCVLWTQSVETLAKEGADTFLEIGPGRVLSGLVRKTARTAQILNVEDLKSLEKAKLALQAQ